MKGASRIFLVITIVGAVLAGAVAIALLFIEGLALFQNTAVLYESLNNQALRLAFRCIAMLCILAHAVLALVTWKKGGALVTTSMLLGFGALIICAFSFLFYEWYIALALLIGNLLLIATPAISMTRARIF